MIGVFAGTSDGKAIVNMLLEKNYNVIVFNGSKAGAEMFPFHENLICTEEKLSLDELKNVIIKYNLKVIVDATHPYAQEITKNLIILKEELSMPYIRYERVSSDVIGYDDYESIIQNLKDKQGKILLTTGSNNLKIFTDNIELSRLYCRVLPTPEVIKKCRDLGFKTYQIIGMQGPFSKAANKLLMEEKDVKYLVTKESGQQGGFKEKIEAARACGVTAMILKRPEMKIKKVYRSYNEIIEEIGRL